MFIYLVKSYIVKYIPGFFNFLIIKIKSFTLVCTEKSNDIFNNNIFNNYIYLKMKSFHKWIYSFQSVKEVMYLNRKLIKIFSIDKKLNNFFSKCYKITFFIIKIIISLLLLIIFIYFELFFYKTCLYYTCAFFYPNNSYLNLINIYWDLFTELTFDTLDIIFTIIRYFVPITQVVIDCVYTYIKEFIYQFIQDLFYKLCIVYFFLKNRFYNIYTALLVTINYLNYLICYYIILFFCYLKDLLISIVFYNWRSHFNEWFNFSKNEQFFLNKINLFFENTFWENTIIMSISISHIACLILILKAWECSQTFNKYQFVSGFFYIVLNSWILLNSSNNLFLLILIILTELTSIFLLTIILINILIEKKQNKSFSIWWLLSLTFLTINTTSYTYFNYYTSVAVQTNPLINFTYICYTTHSFEIIWFIVILTWLILILLNTVTSSSNNYNIFYLLNSTKTFINKIVDNLNIFCEPFINKWNSKKK